MNYILDGKTPILVTDILAWARWFETADRTVARTTVGEAEIRTDFLGVGHLSYSDVPLLFETMIFGGEFDGDIWRYSTWPEAEEGHQAAVKSLMEEHETKLGPGGDA